MSRVNAPASPKLAIAPGFKAALEEEDAAAAVVNEGPGMLEVCGTVGSEGLVVAEEGMRRLSSKHEKVGLEALGTRNGPD